MQYFVRKELDVNESVNLRRLSPFMKIYAGLVTQWHQSKFYKSAYDRRRDAEHAKQVQQDNLLKDAMLVKIYQELDTNETLAKRGEECVEMLLCVKSKFIYSLNRILSSKEFLPYNIERVEEDYDLRIAFPDMPIMLRISKRSL